MIDRCASSSSAARASSGATSRPRPSGAATPSRSSTAACPPARSSSRRPSTCAATATLAASPRLPAGASTPIVDSSAYFPADVEAAARWRPTATCSSRPARSTASRSRRAATRPRRAPTGRPVPDTIASAEDYGGSRCSASGVAERALPGRRADPPLWPGRRPRDPTERFVYWPRRVARGGEVLAAEPDQPSSSSTRATSARSGRCRCSRPGRPGSSTPSAREPLTMASCCAACAEASGRTPSVAGRATRSCSTTASSPGPTSRCGSRPSRRLPRRRFDVPRPAAGSAHPPGRRHRCRRPALGRRARPGRAPRPADSGARARALGQGPLIARDVTAPSPPARRPCGPRRTRAPPPLPRAGTSCRSRRAVRRAHALDQVADHRVDPRVLGEHRSAQVDPAQRVLLCPQRRRLDLRARSAGDPDADERPPVGQRVDAVDQVLPADRVEHDVGPWPSVSSRTRSTKLSVA